jgi:transposase
MTITTIGLDLAKSVFQVHCIDSADSVVLRKKLRRSEVVSFFRSLGPCRVGVEACATAHFWARQIGALGHDVRLMPPSYVKAYLRRQKNDAADAEAICEAVSRPSMRFVPVKSAERQAVLLLHRSRELLVRQRTMLANAIRGHCAEFGLVAPLGVRAVQGLMERMHAEPRALPELARLTLQTLADQLDALATQIHALERRLLTWHRQDQASQRLATIPGVGIITATALAATVCDPSLFRSGREFAAFLGLVPRQNSSGGKDRLGRISKKGDGYLRKLLVVGATSVVRRAKTDTLAAAPWIRALLERRPTRVVTVAMANKTARIAWAVLARGGVYTPA